MTGSTEATSLDLARLRPRLAADEMTVAAVAEAVLARSAAADEAIWICRVAAEALRRRAAALDGLDKAAREALPLFGVPFAVKDNIDVAGLPTTAGCPAFAYTPQRSAPVVERLEAAGAILVGKTNLDQFATGLVGVRSPYGVPRNPFDARYIPGGSSSGSAVAVARGLASFALGTDTAGSGRVPAAFNNIVGLKPTRGLVSARGVVPACRALDCVSILALTCEDAGAVLEAAAGFDAEDPFSRAAPLEAAAPARPFRFGVPPPEDLAALGEAERGLFAAATTVLAGLGGEAATVSLAPFNAAAQLLYDGPWLAERLVATEALLRAQPEALLPVTRGIIEGGRRFSALDAFRASYRLAELRRATEPVWRGIDLLLLPTAPTIYSLADVAAEPVRRNALLGTYTNFVNLLDLVALALPGGFRPDGLPFGVSLIAPAFGERRLLALGRRFQRRIALPLGATGAMPAPGEGRIAVAVAGAHMRGMPLNGRLLALGGELVEEAKTAPCYRMFLIAGEPPRPGLLRVAEGGAAIAIEVWSLAPEAFGTLVAEIRPPLSIGTLLLGDGRAVKGFLCEWNATQGARDITAFGGWRRFQEGG
jgi:allophanate hydrolase